MSTEADYQHELEAAGVTNLDSPKALIAAGWLPPDKAERLKLEIELRLARQREELLTVPGEDATGMSEVEIAIRRRLVEAEAVMRRASDALPGDHEVWWILDDYDGSMDSLKALVRERDEARAELAAVQPVIDQWRDLTELAWGLIANAGEGFWERQRPEWREAAERWRDSYHQLLAVDVLDGGSPEGLKQ